jgi:hypothetical protein
MGAGLGVAASMSLSSRRMFLIGGVLPLVSLIGVAALRPVRAARAADTGSSEGALGREVAGLFSHAEDARSIGRCYLAAHPDEAAGARLLAQELRRQQSLRPGAEGLRRALVDRRRRDLEDGVVVVVGGWVLARTEARACALTVL